MGCHRVVNSFSPSLTDFLSSLSLSLSLSLYPFLSLHSFLFLCSQFIYLSITPFSTNTLLSSSLLYISLVFIKMVQFSILIYLTYTYHTTQKHLLVPLPLLPLLYLRIFLAMLPSISSLKKMMKISHLFPQLKLPPRKPMPLSHPLKDASIPQQFMILSLFCY